ncbi:MAG TPA: CaiB/BaiF CoA-transferase family protein [Acidimicrobiales bacterium]|nr:CaiB/BaiF CoA-transferase family protein [Acidimicrobiales bacterium]
MRVVEMAGLGPGPFAATLLADMGADVVRVERPPSRSDGESPVAPPATSVQLRGRRSICIDLKQPDGVELVLKLADGADVLLEGFRSGVAERVGIGPEVCLERNPRLVYARATGWGQEGPLATAAGHDITYLALSGALYTIGPAGKPPVPPVNYLGDYGGGMHLAFGITSALFERERSGRGQCVDGAILDQLSLVTMRVHADQALGTWRDDRGENLLDGGAHFYGVYETADGRYVAVGAIEPKFYEALLDGLALDPADLPDQMDRSSWPTMRTVFAERFRTRTRDDWVETFADVDACLAPVLTPTEAVAHDHNRARGTFISAWGVVQPAPSPRLSRTPGGLDRPPGRKGEHTQEILSDLGLHPEEITALFEQRAIA